MSIIEVLLLAGCLTTCAWWIISPRRAPKSLRLAPLVVLGLAVLQFALEGSVYVDGLRALPAKVSLMPGFMLATFGRIDTHAIVDAPVSPARRWPVVLD